MCVVVREQAALSPSLLARLPWHSFDYDVDPIARSRLPEFYGYIPDGTTRTVIFGCMVINSALLLLLRSLSIAMLVLVKKRYVVASYGTSVRLTRTLTHHQRGDARAHTHVGRRCEQRQRRGHVHCRRCCSRIYLGARCLCVQRARLIYSRSLCSPLINPSFVHKFCVGLNYSHPASECITNVETRAKRAHLIYSHSLFSPFINPALFKHGVWASITHTHARFARRYVVAYMGGGHGAVFAAEGGEGGLPLLDPS